MSQFLRAERTASSAGLRVQDYYPSATDLLIIITVNCNDQKLVEETIKNKK